MITVQDKVYSLNLIQTGKIFQQGNVVFLIKILRIIYVFY